MPHVSSVDAVWGKYAFSLKDYHCYGINHYIQNLLYLSVHVNKKLIMELLYLKMNDSHDVFYFKLRSRAQSILLSIHGNSASLFLAVYSALWERMEREQTFTRAYIGSTDILNTPRLNHGWGSPIHIHIECHFKALVFPETTIIKPVCAF